MRGLIDLAKMDKKAVSANFSNPNFGKPAVMLSKPASFLTQCKSALRLR